jgi:hypothetical protein
MEPFKHAYTLNLESIYDSLDSLSVRLLFALCSDFRRFRSRCLNTVLRTSKAAIIKFVNTRKNFACHIEQRRMVERLLSSVHGIALLLAFPLRRLTSVSILLSVNDFIQLTKVTPIRLQRAYSCCIASCTDNNNLSTTRRR